MKLNLGSGGRLISGFINIDIEKINGVLQWDLRDGIPFENNSVEFINISQCLEHFNIYEAIDLLKECYRVLKVDGLIRISVPDIEYLIRNIKDLDKFANIQPEIFSRVKSPMLKFSLLALGNLSVDCTREHYTGHQLLLDFDSVKELLKMAGFKKIERKDYHPVLDAEVGKEHSLYVEALK